MTLPLPPQKKVYAYCPNCQHRTEVGPNGHYCPNCPWGREAQEAASAHWKETFASFSQGTTPMFVVPEQVLTPSGIIHGGFVVSIPPEEQKPQALKDTPLSKHEIILPSGLVKCDRHGSIRDPNEEPCWACENDKPLQPERAYFEQDAIADDIKRVKEEEQKPQSTLMGFPITENLLDNTVTVTIPKRKLELYVERLDNMFASLTPPKDQVVHSTGAVRSSEADGYRYDLIPQRGLRRVAATCHEGAVKYSPHNWKKGFAWSEMMKHAQGHLAQYLLGDTSEDHLAHACWNLLALMDYEVIHPELNDIPERQEDGRQTS